MSTQCPLNRQHIAVVCFGLEASNLRKQPWHSIWGITRGLQKQGFKVTVISDSVRPPPGDELTVMTLGRLYDRGMPTGELVAALEALQPDRILAGAGTQELLFPRRFHLGAPVSLVLANQRFRLHELRRIPLAQWRQEWRMLKMPLIQSLLPSVVLRYNLKSSGVAHLIYLSDASQKRHASDGLPPGTVIRPRVDTEFIPQGLSNPDSSGEKLFCYFGPPLLLRGVKDVIAAFLQACSAGMQARLALYIRVDDKYTEQRAAELKDYIDAAASPYKELIHYYDQKLSALELSHQLAKADVFILPFKITVSDVPLVIIEAAMSGKPVITFDTPGISEWRDTFPNIIVSAPNELAVALQDATRAMPVAHGACQTDLTDWQGALAPLSCVLRHPLDCTALEKYRMICLIGVDGCGKSTLLAKLSERLGLAGMQHGYIWSRFRNYISKPFLGLMRLTGHNRKVVINGVRIGLHEFSGNRLISNLFLLLQRFDMWLDIQFRYRPRLAHSLLLGDRCPMDTLVDLAVDTGMEEKVFGQYGQGVFRSIPQPALIVMVTRNSEAAFADRPDVCADPFYKKRVALYQRLAKTFNIPVLRNDGSIEESLRQLCRIAQDSPRHEYVAQL